VTVIEIEMRTNDMEAITVAIMAAVVVVVVIRNGMITITVAKSIRRATRRLEIRPVNQSPKRMLKS
jgi:hypothetical protein